MLHVWIFFTYIRCVKNGHMNKGKWLGKYYHPMEHLGMIFVMFLSAKKNNPETNICSPLQIGGGDDPFLLGKPQFQGRTVSFGLLFAERLWELRKKLLNDYENESSVCNEHPTPIYFRPLYRFLFKTPFVRIFKRGPSWKKKIYI